MAKTRNVFSIFLASPGDLPAERQHAKSCVDEWNQIHADHNNWVVELLGWEDTLPQSGRPQEIINREILGCQLFVGMMWRRWGSNPGGNEGFTSGFEEEFVLASSLREREGSPAIAMFFKSFPPTDDPGDDLKRVISFRKKLIEEKKILYKEIDELHWRDSFRVTLHRLIQEEITKINRLDTKPNASLPDTNVQEIENAETNTSTNSERHEILNEIIRDVNSIKLDAMSSPALSIARLRLVALTWHEHGLSQTNLGVHDANLIYRHGNSIKLSDFEIFGLIDTGLASLSQQIIPLWKWIYKSNSGINYVKIISIFGSEDDVVLGGLKAIGILGLRLNEKEKSMLIGKFSDRSNSVKREILLYMSNIGEQSDLVFTDSSLLSTDYATRNAAAIASTKIRARNSIDDALRFVITQNVRISNEELLGLILPGVIKLSSDSLMDGLAHDTDSVRVKCYLELARRDLLNDDIIGRMKDDPSVLVRKEVILNSIRSGEKITVEDIKRIIKKGVASALSGLGFASETEDRALEEVHIELLKNENDELLRVKMLDLFPPAEFAYKIYYKRNYKTEKNALRLDLENQFDIFFKAVEASYRGRFGESIAKEILSEFEGIKAYRARIMLRYALDVLVEKGDGLEIDLVRQSLTKDNLEVKLDDVLYLRRFGTWNDITLLDSLFSRNVGIYSGMDRTIKQKIAASIYKLGKLRLHELLQLKLSNYVRAEIISMLSRADIRSLDRRFLLLILSDNAVSVRKSMVKRIVSVFDRSVLEEFMESYLSNDIFYYDVVYWLDFGLNSPARALRRAIASEAAA
jgi:hypothetical protein